MYIYISIYFIFHIYIYIYIYICTYTCMQHIGMQICIHIIYMHAAQYPRYPHAFSATPTEQSQDPQSAMLVALAISSPLFIIVMNTVSNIIVDNIITNMVTHIVGNDIHIYIYIHI